MTANAPEFAVVPAENAFAGFRLPSGEVLAIEFTEPQEQWLVLCRDGDSVVILSVHESQPEAARRCRESELEWLEKHALSQLEPPEGPLQ